jgi:hypothetical protein
MFDCDHMEVLWHEQHSRARREFESHHMDDAEIERAATRHANDIVVSYECTRCQKEDREHGVAAEAQRVAAFSIHTRIPRVLFDQPLLDWACDRWGFLPTETGSAMLVSDTMGDAMRILVDNYMRPYRAYESESES